MALNNNLKIKKKHSGYELVIDKKVTIKQYEIVIDYLLKRLDIDEMKQVDDFDSYYHLFTYNGEKMVLSYSVDFGISLFLFDVSIDEEKQKEILNEFAEILSGVNL